MSEEEIIRGEGCRNCSVSMQLPHCSPPLVSRTETGRPGPATEITETLGSRERGAGGGSRERGAGGGSRERGAGGAADVQK